MYNVIYKKNTGTGQAWGGGKGGPIVRRGITPDPSKLCMCYAYSCIRVFVYASNDSIRICSPFFPLRAIERTESIPIDTLDSRGD